MNRLFTSILMIFAVMTASAQQRLRLINTTDYTAVANDGVKKIGSRQGAPLPSTGSPKIPVILVQFSDVKFSSPDDATANETFQKFFNGSGVPGQRYTGSDNYGSVSDYFVAQSDSLFHPQFTVLGPVTLENGYAFYGSNERGRDYNISKFYSEACALAVRNYSVDWTEFDNNGDGSVDFVFFIYAGEGENTSGDADPYLIWPKEQASTFVVKVDENDVKFGGYGCSNEMYDGYPDGIGTSCHELSHALGLPDLYDTSNGLGYGMDYWDLMDAGCYLKNGYAPCSYTAYECDFMGWRPLVTVNYDDKVTLTLEPTEANGVGYKICNPENVNEYFTLENRQNVGWDNCLGYFGSRYQSQRAHGLMITHVDYLQSAWSTNSVNRVANHQRLTIVPADGDAYSSAVYGYDSHFYSSILADLYPGTENVTEMSSYSVYTGGSINMKINNISESNKQITLKLNGGTEANGIASAELGGSGERNIVDLYGRRVVNPVRGIYVVDGRKVVK